MTKRIRPKDHPCLDCPTMVSKRAVRCKPCHGRYAGAKPEYAAIRREANRARYQDPVIRAHQQATARNMVALRLEKQLGWCPPEYLDEYKRLTRFWFNKRRATAAEAKQIILAKIKAELAALSPFERQDRALRNGARIAANVNIKQNTAAAVELRQKLA